MATPPLDSTHGRTTSSVAFHYRLWAAHTVERRLAWHAIIAFGQHKRSNNVRRGMTSPPLYCTHGRQRRAWHKIAAFGQHTQSDNIRRGMPSSPLGSTNGRTTSGMACQHRLWAAYTVERRRAWHSIIAFGQHTWSNDVWRGMPLLPLGNTNGRTTLGVA